MSIVAQQKKKLIDLIERAVNKAIQEDALRISQVPEIHLEVPRDKTHGDFASNIALVLARPAKKNPRQVAEEIVRYVSDEPYIEKLEIAGPGFINFFISNQWLYEVLETIEDEDNNYGSSNYGNGEKLLLEFVSANPVGPLNVVNARAAVIGDTLARLFAAVGYDVATECYINDAGHQMDVFARSLLSRYKQLTNSDVPFPEDGYPGEYVVDVAKKIDHENPNFKELNEEEKLKFCKSWGADKMVESQQKDLGRFNVEFDRWFRERGLHKVNALEEIIELFEEKGFMYEDGGALWFRSTEFGDDKDRVTVKSDANYTYVTADIAYHYDKLKRGFTKLIDILGPDHHGYIGRMKAAIQALGYPPDTLEVLILQYVALLRNGEQVKMSKRAGEFITLIDLLDEVGTDAARYFFLMRSPESHLDFDLTLAVEQSSDNPVFYIQYAHARICSILEQARQVNVEVKTAKEAPLNLLVKESEISLMKKLAEFPEEILTAVMGREPHRVARYALDLATIFHSFYTHCHVLGEDTSVRDARLTLVNSVRIVLKRVLGLLGIDAPEKM